MLYNIYQHIGLPSLATSFLNGVVVDVEYGTNLVISEVMWGEDVSLVDRTYNQYIELHNPGAEHKTVDDDAATFDVDERLTLIFYAPNDFGAIAAKTAVAATRTAPATMALPGRVVDRIGTLDATGAYWNPSTKGQSGSSGVPLQDAADDLEVTIARTPVTPIVSMYRMMETDGTIDAITGQMAASWLSSLGPKSANFMVQAIGVRHGTPGAATDATDTPADTEAEEKATADAAKADADKIASTGTMPEDGQIYISEIMFAGGGSLPQWIEISNGSRTEEVNLSGWTITVDNARSGCRCRCRCFSEVHDPRWHDGLYEWSGRYTVHDPRCHGKGTYQPYRCEGSGSIGRSECAGIFDGGRPDSRRCHDA